MAYFIEIKGQIYQVPNRIVVGRSEPFTNIKDDHSIARAHAFIMYKNKKFYIKDLESDSGIFINGKRIKANKFHEVKPDDSINLGTQGLRIFTNVTSQDFIEVHRNVPDISFFDRSSSIYLYFILFFISFSCLKLYELSSFSLFNISIVLTGTFIITIIALLFAKYFFIKGPSYILPTEIIYSKDGFTLYFENHKKNMSFKINEIETWDFVNKKTIHINIYRKSYTLTGLNYYPELISLLKKECAQKEIRNKKNYPDLIFLTFGLLILSNQVTNLQILPYINYLTRALIIIMLLALFNLRYLDKVLPDKLLMLSTAKKRIFIILFAGIFYSTNDQIHKNKNILAQIKSCDNEFSKNCQNIDYFSLMNFQSFQIDQKIIHKACKNNNESACQLVRDIASKKTSK